MDEQNEYEIIKALVEQGGSKTRAALKLQCSRRTVDRHIAGYKNGGKAYFSHGNRGRQPAHTTPKETEDMIIDLYNSKYSDCTYKLFAELLASKEQINVSATKVTALLKERLIPSPKSRRRTRRAFAKAMREKLGEPAPKAVKEELEARIAAAEEAHPRRPRCANFGEMLQMDASLHPWFGAGKATLHIAVDDATGMIVGAWFDGQETLDGYYNVFRQVLTEYGIPYMFYTDRRTVFEYKQMKNPTVEKDYYTQFAYACHQFGVEIKTTSVAQAKGRVERMFGTLQSRLPVMLRLAGVTTIDQANAYLTRYVKEFNAKFALDYNNMPSVFDKQPCAEKINLTLAVLTKRKVDIGHSVRFDNKYYRTLDGNGAAVYYYSGTEGLVVRAFDGSLYFCVGDDVRPLEEIPPHERASRNFDFRQPNEPARKKYVPPMNHPWRLSCFEKFRKKQPSYADVNA
jgi:transposase